MTALCTTAAMAQSVTATTTSLAVTSSGSAATSVSAGTVVTFTAIVKSGATSVAKGQVDFCEASAKFCTDIHLLGTAQLTSAGTATLKLRPEIGSHSYKAVFRGTNTYAGSASGAQTLAVTGTLGSIATASTIAENGSWGNYTLTATVMEAGSTTAPTGTVSFLDASNGNSTLASGTLGTAIAGVSWPKPKSLSNISNTEFVVVADFNGDGIPDLAVESNYVSIYLGNADGSFTKAVGPSIQGPTDHPIVVADFNGDGILDLAVPMYGTNQISIVLGKGDGSFAAPVQASVPGTMVDISQMLTGDFNGDGIPDLAVVDRIGATVEILLGNGDGTFTTQASNPPISGTPSYIATGDFNGDGKADLAVDAGGDVIAILLGNGDGTFASAGTVHSGTNGSPIAVADFNADGKLDIAVAEGGTFGTNESVTILTGNGDGTFNSSYSATNPSSTTVTWIQVADFNQDGVPDVVQTDSNGNATVLVNDGSGSIKQSFPVVSGLSVPYYFEVGVGDLNGDGYPDIIAGAYYSNTLGLYLTQPTQTATASASISLPAGLHQVDASYAGDSSYNPSTSGTTSLWGVPRSTTTTLSMTSGGGQVTSVAPNAVVTLTAAVAAGTAPVTNGQVNFCDAAATYCTDIHLLGTVALNANGSAAFKFVPGAGTHSYKAVFVENGYGLSSASGAASLTVGPAPAPVYSDSVAILQSGNPGNYSLTATVVGYGGSASPTGSVSFLDTSNGNALLASAALGSSTSGLGWLVSQTGAIGAVPLTEVAGDFNGDGISDVVVLWSSNYGMGPFSLTILLGKGDGTFTTGSTTQLTGIQSYGTIIAGDLNGDGKTDLAILSSNYYSISYVTALLGNGDGTFAAPKTSQAFNQGAIGGDIVAASIVAADFNGDSKMDLAVVGGQVGCGEVTILLGNGDGTFTSMGTNYGDNYSFSEIATGDFNGDGMPDLVVSNYFSPSNAIVLLGKGDGTFVAEPTQLPVDSFARSIVVADFNGDGVMDLAFGYDNAVEVYIGKGDGTFMQASGSPITGAGLGLLAADFNHDGKLDLAAIDQYAGQIDIYVGDGGGKFTPTVTSPKSGTNSAGPKAIITADFNSDGVPDLAMLTGGQTTASILLGEPTQTATATVTGIAPVGAGTHNMEASYAGDSNYGSGVSGTVALQAALTPVTFSPAAGTYTSAQTITLSETIPGATIYYSMGGPVATQGYVPYTGPITLNLGGVERISAFATETGYLDSTYTFATYTMKLPAAPVPVISPAAGSYSGPQIVTITDTAANATIYYTTDGTAPSTQSSVYSGPISVSTSETVAAVASAPGYSTSGQASAQFVIDSAQSSFIYTLAGNGDWGYGGDGGPATFATLNTPLSGVADSQGNLYIVDSGNNMVRKVAAGSGIITVVAGTGTPGYSGDGGPATSAQFSYPTSLAIDASGNLYITDTGNKVVRQIAASTGIITTYAGSASATSLGDGGPAINAQFTYPFGLALDKAGNLYIGDQSRVRKVTASTGTITTVAGSGSWGFSGDNGPATSASLKSADGIALNSAGDLFIADEWNSVVRKVAANTGIISTVAGTAPTMYQTHSGYSGDGGPATSAQLSYPKAVAVDAANNLYIADTGNYAIREVTASDGLINTIAGHPAQCLGLSGDGGPARDSAICSPQGISLDSAGNIYVAESGSNRMREITAPALPPAKTTAAPTFNAAPGTYVGPQTVTISSATPGAAIYVTLNGKAPTTMGEGYHGTINVTGSSTLQAIAVAPGYLPSTAVTASYTITTPPASLINTVAGTGVYGGSGVGGPAASASLGYLNGVAVDNAGNLYIADLYNYVVWVVAPGTGTINVAAGTLGERGNGSIGNGGPATSAFLNNPSHLALDSAGNLYIADSGNNLVRKVDAKTGAISIYAGGGNAYTLKNFGDGGPATSGALESPQGLALDAADNLYIADYGTSRIRMVSASTGIMTTVAGGGKTLGDGGSATSAALGYPNDVAVDGNGNVYIADTGNARVRVVNAGTGIISTLAGNGLPGATGDGGPAIAARINPAGLALDGAGNLYISSWPDTIRKVPVGGGTITTAAGVGYWGFSGDGGSATMGELDGPTGLAFDKAGSLYIADEYNYVVRKMTLPVPAATPTFTPAAGTYTSTQAVTITDSTQGATIYYTIDGSAPNTSSSVYSAPIPVASSATVNAIAVAAGYTQSAVASAAYTILPPAATPTFSPAAGTYVGTQSVTISDATNGATIYYTIDESTPTTNSAVYSGPVSVSSSETINAIASGNGYSSSAVASAAYIIHQPNTAPSLGTVSPPFVTAGTTAFSLTINGSGFVNGSTAYWGTTALPTQYVGATQLSAQVTAAQIASAGVNAITVQTPAPGGGTSNAIQFEVDTAGSTTPPSFTTTSATVKQGSMASYPVTLPTSASNVTVSCLNLPSGATCSYSASTGALAIATSSTTPAGTYQITAVFTETLPGSMSALVYAPFLLLPLAAFRKRWTKKQGWFVVLVAIALATAGFSGCGGGSGSGGTNPPANPTHQVTSSGTVTLTVQ